MNQPYICECEPGYYWHGKTGCRNKKAGLGNICTGSKECFDNETVTDCTSEGKAFYGQDAQYADKGFCVPKNFSVGGTAEQQTTIDNSTGLEWQKSGGYMNWTDAKTYCAGLNNIDNTGVVYGGVYKGLSVCDPASSDYDPESSDCEWWRLPTIRELMTIVDYGKTIPPLDPAYFDYTEYEGDYRYWGWSSTEGGSGPYYFVYKILGNGYLFSFRGYKNTKGDVHCVRGTTLPKSSFVKVNNEVVKDTTTGLYWQEGYYSGEGSDVNWEDALSYCENLDYAGFSDWRLPNINELNTLVYYEKNVSGVIIDTLYFSMPSTSDIIFWSSTTPSFVGNKAAAVGFEGSYSGAIVLESKTDNENHYVRCVRSDLCGTGEFWDGKNCVANPCSANSCAISNSDGICTPLTYNTFSCGCVDGYVWDQGSGSCLTDPCFDNKCALMPGSDGVCTQIDTSNFTCGCIDGYFWDGLRCRNEKVIGNICTGQIKCYNMSREITCPAEDADFFGQDANYALNAARETCIPQKGYEVETPASEDQKVVIDKSTELMWQQTIKSKKFTWYGAVNYCADLEYAGYTDWRLPKPKELLSILDPSIIGSSTPHIDTTYFPSDGYDFWASKKFAKDTTRAWIVNFKGNNTDYTYPQFVHDFSISEEKYVRCVRGKPLPEKSSFSEKTINGQVVGEDSVTGLMWQKPVENNCLLWSAALSYCETSAYAGFTDWRLPNVNELISIVNYDRAWPSSDFIPNFRLPWYWSSTNISGLYVYVIDFKDGGVLLNGKDFNTTNVICVR